jgi:hypothetical protein
MHQAALAWLIGPGKRFHKLLVYLGAKAAIPNFWCPARLGVGVRVTRNFRVG